jgi:RNA polymerase sigma-70 factor (ECF subfamily)
VTRHPDQPSSHGQATSALLKRAKAGDHEALGALLERFRNPLCDHARQLLSPELAQKVSASDLVQETCIDAMRDFHRARLDHVKSLEAWLVALLANNLIDWQRRFKRSKKRDLRRERPLQEIGSKAMPLRAPSHQAPTPDEIAIDQEATQRLQKSLQELPRGYREIILWRNQERLTWKQIAKRLSRTEDAARMLWKRAVERLKRQLQQK